MQTKNVEENAESADNSSVMKECAGVIQSRVLVLCSNVLRKKPISILRFYVENSEMICCFYQVDLN